MSVLSFLDLAVIVVFLLLFVGIAISFSRKGSQNVQHFFLGGRNLPWYVAGTSMVATTFAADTPLAVTELVAKHGISGNWLWWNMLAGGMLTTFFFAKYWRRAGVLTDIELIKIRYSGRAAHILRISKAFYMGVFLNILIIGWVNLAFITLIQIFFDLSYESTFFITAIVLFLVIIYSAVSGLLGIVYSDVLQFVMAMVGSIVLAYIILDTPQIEGVMGLKNKIDSAKLSFFPSIDSLGSAHALTLGVGSFFAFITVQWWASWYPGNEPGGGGYIAQRMMSAKNEKHAVYSSLFFQMAHYCIRPWPWIIVALASLVLYPDLPNPREGYVMAMKDFLPSGFRGLLLVAFLAAYMSTISTQLNWGVSYIVNDGIVPLKIFKTKNLVAISRIATVILALLALLVTKQLESISGVWQFLMECGAGLGLVLILRWYWWRVNAWAEIVATIMPFIAYSVAHFILNWVFPSSFLFTVFVTTTAWLVTVFISKPTDKNVLQKFFDTVKPMGIWTPFGKSKGSILHLFLLWILGIIMAYSLLFLMGSILFNTSIFLYLSLFVVSLLIFSLLIKQYVKF